MSKADEMLDELGYIKKHDNKRHIVYKNGLGIIEFTYRDKWVYASFHINMQELEAINEKCKELRLDKRGERVR